MILTNYQEYSLNKELILQLTKRLPASNEDHEARLEHVLKHGHILLLVKDGTLKGYAELFVMDHIPDHPAVPYPVSVKNGDYLYCFAAVCDQGYIKELITMVKNTFKNCKFLIYHRHKKDNKLHIERINHV